MFKELDQSCMDQFVAGLAGDIAADKLTVHADAFAGYLLETLLHQVYAGSFLVLAYTPTEQVIGIYRWSHIRQKFQAESLPCQEIKLALFKQILVTAAESLLQDRHTYEYAD